MKDVEQKALGVLLISNEGELIEHLSRIKPEWFTHPFHQRVFKSIVDIYSRGQDANTLSVLEDMRSDKFFMKKTAAQVSVLTNDVPRSMLEIDSMFSYLASEYNKTIVYKYLSSLQSEFTTDSLTIDKFVEMSRNTIDSVLGDEVIKQTNEQVVYEVIQDHDKAKSGQLPGITIGHSVLEESILLEPNDVMVIGARPAMGKSAFAIQTIKNMTFEGMSKIAFFCIEMSNKQLIRRLLANTCEIDSEDIRRGRCSEDQITQMKSVVNHDGFMNFHIFTGDHSVAQIASISSNMKHNGGLDLIIIDYVQKVTPSNPKESETSQVKLVCNDLKRMTQRLGIPQIQFAQLLKDSSKEGRRPVLPDLKQTGDIEQDATIVAFLHRPSYYGQKTMPDDQRRSGNLCEFIIAKNRDGALGIKEFKFTPEYSKFEGHFYERKQAPEDLGGEQTDLPF